MARRIAPLPPPTPPLRKQQHLSRETPTGSSRLAEVAGGTAAEFVAVGCCCPCVIVDILVVTVVKLPAGLCRKALQKKRYNRRIGLLQPKRLDEDDLKLRTVSAGMWLEKSPAMEVCDMEKEMWSKFYSNGNGFWRNPSERE